MFNGLWEGREIHGEVMKAGFERDVFVRNGLIGMYCKTEELGCAWLLFDAFWEKDLVSWNLMLNGYVGVGEMGKAQKVFDEMPERDVISWSIMIDGYGKKIGDVIRARVLFDSILIRDLVSWNSMIDSYAKVGEMTTTRQLFEEMEEKNVISWSIIIDGYARNGNPKESLVLFRQMLCQGVKPDKVSLAGALLACAQLGALDQGRWNHITNESSMIFNSMSERNVVTWNVMIPSLGINGFAESAVECFAQMEREGIPMDDLIFVSVLTTCTHAGFVTEGLDIFDKMRTHGIEPKLEHYGCLIDLLGRSRRLNQAQILLESMSIKPNSALWGSLFLACRTHKNVALAEVVLERLVELKADDCRVYILMSNIYADAEMWEGV
ncbi:pentatricopeptide repeat (PPR-like) superfamily protein [Actinidia rufa]|uniref:Pentatricopeptide repeat (PPR-like) superfamily protein n=1 Tax=Actinidia rufa TaxID=165716 RepID=A0A7J0GQQ0_9ERIC|nr:pentatricopeptide repeat (PPR-like) superfamily protein [Actinidia rufa]